MVGNLLLEENGQNNTKAFCLIVEEGSCINVCVKQQHSIHCCQGNTDIL